MKTLSTDVAIIGSGTAGMGAFRAAREHTKNVMLIESGPYGTTCARVGCMPSKLLIAAAEAAHRAEAAPTFGVHPGAIRVDGHEVMDRVRTERDRFVGFVVDSLNEWPDASKLRGRARFVGPGKLQIGDDIALEAERVVIATGSEPFVPVGWRKTLGDRLVVNDDVFDWQTLPKSVGVVGGGVIGLELAQALHRLGVRVKVFTRKGRLGPLTDPDLAKKTVEIITRELTVSLDADDIRVARVNSGTGNGQGAGDEVEIKWWDGGIEHCDRFEFLLAAAGRRPQLDDLDLGAAGIELGVRGVPHFVRETGQIGLASENRPVFIAGDVTNVHPLLHEAADDGRIAGDNAGRYPDVRVHTRRAPLAVVFTDPQLMIAGLSHRVLCKAGTGFEIGAASFDDQGRSRVMAQNSGLIHVYGAHHTGEFLGAEMVGPAAEHIGHLLAWAAQQKMTVQQMLDSPFYHPVVEEGVRTALRDLNRKLRLGPPPVARSMDCGPGA